MPSPRRDKRGQCRLRPLLVPRYERTTSKRTTLPVGITREKDRTGYLVEARVRPFPLRRQRFATDTPIDEMVAWRTTQIKELTAQRDAIDRVEAVDPGCFEDHLQNAPTPRGISVVATTKHRRRIRSTFREDVDRYLAERINPRLHPNTRAQFERWLRLAAATELGRYPRHFITGAMWTALVAHWERSGIPATAHAVNDKKSEVHRHDGGDRRRIVPPGRLAVDTVHKIRTCFISFYKTMDAGMQLPNPARAIPWRKKPTTVDARGIPMPLALRILDCVTGGQPTRTAARLTLMCVLGLRPVEIMRITPAIDWDRTARTLAVRTAKGGKPRTLLLGDRAVAALKILDRLNGWGPFSTPPAARLFHVAVAAAGLAELEPLRPYDLRHTFGTEAYRLTGDLKAVAAAMGHRNLSQTERYVEATVSANVAQLFDALARSTPPAPHATRRRGSLHAV